MSFKLHVIETKPTNRITEIVCRMNERFRSQEQFEQQVDTICLDIALAMKGKMDRIGTYFRLDDNLIFNFTRLPEQQIIERLERSQT
jgi:hypothetical protein